MRQRNSGRLMPRRWGQRGGPIPKSHSQARPFYSLPPPLTLGPPPTLPQTLACVANDLELGGCPPPAHGRGRNSCPQTCIVAQDLAGFPQDASCWRKGGGGGFQTFRAYFNDNTKKLDWGRWAMDEWRSWGPGARGARPKTRQSR